MTNQPTTRTIPADALLQGLFSPASPPPAATAGPFSASMAERFDRFERFEVFCDITGKDQMGEGTHSEFEEFEAFRSRSPGFCLGVCATLRALQEVSGFVCRDKWNLYVVQ